jgi:pyridoxamine 5'-phosphate oxidase
MIEFKNNSPQLPFIKLKNKYTDAKLKNQSDIEAISISSYSKKYNEVSSRFVNLKYIDNGELIFFSNYNSQKAMDINSHDQISALIFWNKINTQIRIKAKIQKKSVEYNQDYFSKRSKEKNALALSSKQSMPIDSYENVKKNHKKALTSGALDKCPPHWGGYACIPYYFEFWEGHHSRINKREVYNKNGDNWDYFILEP